MVNITRDDGFVTTLSIVFASWALVPESKQSDQDFMRISLTTDQVEALLNNVQELAKSLPL